MRHHLLVVLVLVGLPHSAAAQPERFWYNASCRQRALASLEDFTDTHVFLRLANGQSICVPFKCLAPSDRLYLSAVEDAVKAAIHVSRASYPAPFEERYLSQLVEKNHLDAAMLCKLADIPRFGKRRREDRKLDDIDEEDSRHRDSESTRRAFATRKLDDIQTRWVAIDRFQYKVARADVANNATGLTSLTLRTDQGDTLVDPAQTPTPLSVLPIFWDQQVFAPGLRRPLRKKTLERVYSKGHVWEYELVYSDIAGIWTDPEIAAAYERMGSSQRRFDIWPLENLLSEAAWNFHRANSIVKGATGANWEQSFPWLDGNWKQHAQLSLALGHYTRSLELVPNWGEAMLRRAALLEGMQKFPAALDELGSFRQLNDFMPRLPITGRPAEYLSHHADVIQSRVCSQLGDHYGAIENARFAMDAKIEVAKSADLVIDVVRRANADAAFWAAAPPGPTLEMHIDASVAALGSAVNLSQSLKQKQAAVALLKGILQRGSSHFVDQRDSNFRQKKVLEALLAAKTAAKYTTRVPGQRIRQLPPLEEYPILDNIKNSVSAFKQSQFSTAMDYARRARREDPTDRARDQYDQCLKLHASLTFALGF